jgi:hypothetical protein
VRPKRPLGRRCVTRGLTRSSVQKYEKNIHNYGCAGPEHGSNQFVKKDMQICTSSHETIASSCEKDERRQLLAGAGLVSYLP